MNRLVGSYALARLEGLRSIPVVYVDKAQLLLSQASFFPGCGPLHFVVDGCLSSESLDVPLFPFDQVGNVGFADIGDVVQRHRLVAWFGSLHSGTPEVLLGLDVLDTAHWSFRSSPSEELVKHVEPAPALFTLLVVWLRQELVQI